MKKDELINEILHSSPENIFEVLNEIPSCMLFEIGKMIFTITHARDELLNPEEHGNNIN